MARVLVCTVVVVVDVDVLVEVDDVVPPGTEVDVEVEVEVATPEPEDVSRINVEPVDTAVGFFVEPDIHPATRPFVTVELGIAEVDGHVAVTRRAARAVVAAAQVMPTRCAGTVTGTLGGPLETVTANDDPPATLVPAAGVWVTTSPAFTVADATCAVTLRVSPSLLTRVDASARVSP
jgi:hypothetical protein